MCFIPVLRGTSHLSMHNGFMYVMRSIGKVSDSTTNENKFVRESHMTKWVCAGRFGLPVSQKHADDGFGSDELHSEYPHIYKQSAFGSALSSIVVFAETFGQSYNNQLRKSMTMWRTEDNDEINPGTGLRKIDEWSNYQRWGVGIPWGAGYGIYGNGGIDDAQNKGQLVHDGDGVGLTDAEKKHGADGIVGYKFLDYWTGESNYAAPDSDKPKGYTLLVHGKPNKIGLFSTTGMDSNQNQPYKDLYYLQSRDGISWENINGTFTKNVFTGQSVVSEACGYHNSWGDSEGGHPWICLGELSDPKNLFWIASSVASRMNGETHTNAFSTVYGGDMAHSYTEGDLNGKVAWEGDLISDFQGRVGGLVRPTNSTNASGHYAPEAVVPGYGAFDGSGGENVHLYCSIYEYWAYSSGTSSFPITGGPSGNDVLGDTCIITFDFDLNCWKLLSDGRPNIDDEATDSYGRQRTIFNPSNKNWGRDYRRGNGGDGDTHAYGQVAHQIATFSYGAGRHEIWLTFFGKTTGAGRNLVGGTDGSGQFGHLERWRTIDNFQNLTLMEDPVADTHDLAVDTPDFISPHTSIARPMLPYNLSDLEGYGMDGITINLQSFVHRFQGQSSWDSTDLYDFPARMWSTVYEKTYEDNINRSKIFNLKLPSEEL